MDKYIPIQTFDHIYLVDLCEPLLRVARERFERKGWKNITVLCQDACNFNLPEWKDGIDPKGSVSLVTLSYSLSMVRFPTLHVSRRSKSAVDTQFLPPFRPHKSCHLAYRGIDRCGRFLCVHCPTIATRESNWWIKQAMQLVYALVLANLVRF